MSTYDHSDAFVYIQDHFKTNKGSIFLFILLAMIPKPSQLKLAKNNNPTIDFFSKSNSIQFYHFYS